MEEKYKQVTDIISDLAARNPYITREQIAKAKSMYNGDERPIEVIRAELEAYSAQIEMQAKKIAKEKENNFSKDRVKAEDPAEKETGKVPLTPIPPVQAPEALGEPEETLETLRTELPGEDERRELQSMIDDALGAQTSALDSQITFGESNPMTKETGKVLVKKDEQNQSSNPGNTSPSSDGGYGNVTALLSLTIIFSIVTIIMAFFTIISR